MLVWRVDTWNVDNGEDCDAIYFHQEPTAELIKNEVEELEAILNVDMPPERIRLDYSLPFRSELRLK